MSSEPVAEPEVGFCSRNVSANDRPSHAEILLPPIFLTLAILGGLVGLILLEKWRSHRSVKRHYGDECAKTLAPDNNENEKMDNVVEHIVGDSNFMSAFDQEVLNEMEVYYNQPKQLLIICVPAFMSLVFTALIMFMFEPMVHCMWPNMTERPRSINTAVTCFLAPAGLVYALSFGFTFQQALEKNSTTLRKVTEELSQMDQMITMITKMNLPTQRHVMAMCKAVKSEVIFMSMLVQNREAHTFVHVAPRNIKVHVWSVLDVLRDAADHPEYMFNVNTILVDKLVTYLLKLNSICTDRLGSLHTRIHPLMWIFLEMLGSLVLLGVILIDAKSRRMELAMCELTIFSVSMLCYVLADLDSPFNGFFRVDLGVLPDVIKRIEYIFNQAKCNVREDAARHSLGSMEMKLFRRKPQPPMSTELKTETAKEMVPLSARSTGQVALSEENKEPPTVPEVFEEAQPRTGAPGAHGVMSVTHAGRTKSSDSMETQLTDIN